MNIAIATSSFPLNRSEPYHRYIEDVTAILHQYGHKVIIQTQDKKGTKENFIPFAEVVWFPWRISQQQVLSQLSLNKIRNIFSILSLIYNGVRWSKKITHEKK